MCRDPTRRFSSRVANYIRYRPGYPEAVLTLLERTCGLTSDSTVADVGSGTGILTALLLPRVCRVLAVEPNRGMREAAERSFSDTDTFRSVDGRAEATGLEDRSADLITAGQAFHWFDIEKTRAEFARILRPGGHVALVWNDRKIEATPFLREYEVFLRRFGTDYDTVRHQNINEDDIATFFGPGGYDTDAFPNRQVFDLEGLEGRVLSSSYVPAEGEPGCEAMLAALKSLFEIHQRDGSVVFEYATRVFHGTVAEGSRI